MSMFKSIRAVLYVFGFIGAIVCLPAIAAEPTPEALLQTLNEYPHARQIAFLEAEVIDHEVGLGAIQKVRGKWRFKNSGKAYWNLV